MSEASVNTTRKDIKMRYSIFPYHHGGLIPLLKVKKKQHKEYIRKLLSLQLQFINQSISFWQTRLRINQVVVFDFPFEYPLVYLPLDLIVIDITSRKLFDISIYKDKEGKILPYYWGSIVSKYFGLKDNTLQPVASGKKIFYHSLEIPVVKHINVLDMIKELPLFVSYDKQLTQEWKQEIYEPFKELDNLHFLFSRVLGFNFDMPFEIITKDEDIFILPICDLLPLNENVEPVYSEIKLI